MIKKAGQHALGGLSLASVIGIAYAGGIKSAEVDHLKERVASNEAMIMKTRESIDDKIDQLIKSVAALDAKVSSKRIKESE